ncbi:MAG: hypothetical protein FWE40_04810 [Oscillospiraceae bacterium]|nr:hypothetical protein [Oscillospiraceae bacterium]
MPWKSFSGFVQEQIESIRQTEENLKVWKVARLAAMQRGDHHEAFRLEKLIDVSTADMRDKSIQVQQLLKGRS